MTFPVFASGDVLNASDMNAVGLWLVKTQTIGSAVSSVAVTDAFSSTYDNYRILISGGTSSAETDLNFVLGSTTTGYYYSIILNTYSGNTVTAEGGSNQAKMLYFGVARANGLQAASDIIAPNLAKRTHMLGLYSGAGNSGLMTGMLDNTTAYTGFTIAPNSGTITGGTIRVYGYRN